MCPVDHPDANGYFSWDHDLGFGWITDTDFTGRAPPFNGLLQKNIGIEQAETLSCLSIMQLLLYLESNRFNYLFMIMNNYILVDSPDWFMNFLKRRKDKWITFDRYQTVYDYVRSNNLTHEEYRMSPSIDGHKLIAQTVAKTLGYP